MPELQIGRVIKPHGVKGEVVVDPSTDHVEERFAVGEALRGVQAGRERVLTVSSFRRHQARLLVKFEEIADRTEAESLRGCRFFAAPIVDDGDDGFYDHELTGLHVLNVGAVDEDTAHRRAYEGEQPEPEDIGEVIDVHHGPAGAHLEVRIDPESSVKSSAATVLIPFKQAIVPIVDLDNEAIVITPPEGLLEL